MKKTSVAILCISFAVGTVGYFQFPKTETAEEPKVFQSNTLLPARTKTELIGSSKVIIKGTVQEALASTWSNANGEKGPDARNIIQTDIVVRVDEVFKGTPYHPQEIKVRINKGQVGETVWHSTGHPDFKQGEEAILFLVQDSSEIADKDEEYYVLAGMRQGKFTLTEKTDKDKKFSNDKDSIQLSTFKDEIPKEIEKFNNLPKPTNPANQQKSQL